MSCHTEVTRWISDTGATVHKYGRIILSPPGSGKSYFVAHGNPHWVDIDDFLGEYLGFHTEAWHSQSKTEKEIREHYLVCDEYLKEMKSQKLWVVGSLFWEYLPDKIVLLEVSKHKDYVKERPDLMWDEVQKIRNILKAMAKKHNIPIVTSWGELRSAQEYSDRTL